MTENDSPFTALEALIHDWRYYRGSAFTASEKNDCANELTALLPALREAWTRQVEEKEHGDDPRNPLTTLRSDSGPRDDTATGDARSLETLASEIELARDAAYEVNGPKSPRGHDYANWSKRIRAALTHAEGR